MHLLKRIAYNLGAAQKVVNLIVIGAQKAGTSSLHKMLSQHPLLVPPSKKKELHFFDNDELYRKSDIEVYHDFFPSFIFSKDKLLFETTPSYIYHPLCAERIYKYNPNVKLILVLREPASRALSAWNMYNQLIAAGRTTRFSQVYKRPESFEACINQELENIDSVGWETNPAALVKRGVYYEQIENYFQLFSRDQLLILENKELRHDLGAVSQKVCTFLEIPFLKFQLIEANVRSYPQQNFDKELALLRDFYKEHNEKLFSLLGKRYDW